MLQKIIYHCSLNKDESNDIKAGQGLAEKSLAVGILQILRYSEIIQSHTHIHKKSRN